MNRSAGLGVAVREFPTDTGPVDYVLFVGGTLCGVGRGEARRYDPVRLLGPGRALYGQRARASHSKRGASPLRICRLRHRDPIPRSCRPGAAVAPPVLLLSARDAAALARGADDDPPAATIDAAALNRASARVSDRRGHEARGLACRRPPARGSRWPRAPARPTPPACSAIGCSSMRSSGACCFSPTAPISSARRGMNSRTFARPAPADPLPNSTTSSGWGRRVSTRMPRSSSRRSSGSIRC
jgi:hypothetical protein